MNADPQPTNAPVASTLSAEQAATLKGKRGWRRLLNAARYSVDGFRAAWRYEEAFRQEVIVAALLLPLALWLPVTAVERVLLIGSVLLVLIVELLNSCIETAVDRDSTEINSLGKRAKDMGSAAVVLAILLALSTWGCVLWSRYMVW